MARHHYVPRFLLRRWSTSGRFVAYYWDDASNRPVENQKATVASACQIPDLNTFLGVPESQRDFPETGFFTPRVDTPAAAALREADGAAPTLQKQHGKNARPQREPEVMHRDLLSKGARLAC